MSPPGEDLLPQSNFTAPRLLHCPQSIPSLLSTVTASVVLARPFPTWRVYVLGTTTLKGEVPGEAPDDQSPRKDTQSNEIMCAIVETMHLQIVPGRAKQQRWPAASGKSASYSRGQIQLSGALGGAA